MVEPALKAELERDLNETKGELIDLHNSKMNEVFRDEVQKLSQQLLLEEILELGFEFKETILPPEGYEDHTKEIAQRWAACISAPEEARPQMWMELGRTMDRIWTDKAAPTFNDKAKEELGL